MLETRPSSLPQSDVRLRDGRRLAYAEYGDPGGRPVLFFHGTPGSRLFHHPDDSITAAAGARVIVIERPGFGRSDFKPGRRILDWPEDVLQLAEALNLTRFAVLGYSSGGPYAAACALSIPDRLTGVGMVSSVAPMESPDLTRGMHGIGHVFLNLDRHLSPLARLGTGLMCNLWRDNPEAYFKSQLEGLRDSEAARALVPGIKAMLTADFREAIRNGTDGVTFELKLLSRPWGFQPGAIKPEVLLWHGENDTETPVAMGKRLAGTIPRCHAAFFSGEGHWAIYLHWREILTDLLANAGPAPLHDLGRTPLSVSALSDPAADSGQGLPPAALAADAPPADWPGADTASRTEAPENRRMSIVEVIESLADAPPEVPCDAPAEPTRVAEAPAPAEVPAEPAEATAPAQEAPPGPEEPSRPDAEATAPAEGSAPLTAASEPPAEEPATAATAPEPIPEPAASAGDGPAEAPLPLTDAPATRKKAARRGKAALQAAGSAAPDPAAQMPTPPPEEAAPVSRKKRPHAEDAPRGKAPLPQAKKKEKEDRPAPERGKSASKPPSRPVSAGARGRPSGEARPTAGKGAAPAKKTGRQAAGPATRGTPGKAPSGPEAGEPATRKPGAGRKSAREPVHA